MGETMMYSRMTRMSCSCLHSELPVGVIEGRRHDRWEPKAWTATQTARRSSDHWTDPDDPPVDI
eukprot:scaffold37593_cov56-Attheya_sp.AAC.2